MNIKKTVGVLTMTAMAVTALGQASTNLDERVVGILREQAPTNCPTGVCAVIYRVADGRRLASASLGGIGPDTAFEIGSVLKPLTLVAALEAGVAKAETEYTTNRDDPKYWRLPMDGGHQWPPTMTVADGIVRSSNIVLGKLSADVGPTNLIATFKALGLGSRGGYVPRPERISRADMSRLGIGMKIRPTLDEVARAYVIMASGGKSPWTGEQVVRKTSVEPLTPILMRVVSPQGTARRAAVDGLSIAGKTGTTMRFEAGQYVADRYHATFVGYFPAEKPEYVVAVTCLTARDAGQRHQGDQVPAAMFKQIASQLVNLPSHER